MPWSAWAKNTLWLMQKTAKYPRQLKYHVDRAVHGKNAMCHPASVFVMKMGCVRREVSRSVLKWVALVLVGPWPSVKLGCSGAAGRLSPLSASGPVTRWVNKICYTLFCLLLGDMSKCVSSWAGHTLNLALPNVSSAVKSTAADETVHLVSSESRPEALH